MEKDIAIVLAEIEKVTPSDGIAHPLTRERMAEIIVRSFRALQDANLSTALGKSVR